MKRIRTGTAHLLTCNDDCAQRWVLAHVVDAPDALIDEVPARMRWACAACCWCGTTCAPVASGPCAMHGDTCPLETWLLSDFCRQAIRQLRRARCPPLTDMGWRYLQAAGELYQADVVRVAEAVLKFEPEWNVPAGA